MAPTGDYYGLLKSKTTRNQETTDANGTHIVVEVELIDTTYQNWQTAPRTHKILIDIDAYEGMQEKVYGRRINDDVDLFAMEDGNETPGLREQMEKKGLTVRFFVPEATTGQSVTQTEEETTLLNRCAYRLLEAIVEHENKIGDDVEYALITDSGIRGRIKQVLVAIVDMDVFEEVLEMDKHAYTFNGVEYKILALFNENGVTFITQPKDLEPFFPEGSYENIKFHNDLKIKEEEAAEAARHERKVAKKQRRKQGAPSADALSGTSPDLHGTPHEEEEEAETRAKAKKDNANVKRGAASVEEGEAGEGVRSGAGREGGWQR